MRTAIAIVIIVNVAYGFYAYSDYSAQRQYRFRSLAILRGKTMKRFYSPGYISWKIDEVKECESLMEARELFTEIVLNRDKAKKILLHSHGKRKLRKKYYFELEEQ